MKLSDYSWPTTYEKPLNHQIITTLACIQNKRFFVLNTMGTGKTLSCLWAVDILLITKKISKVLIVAPLSTVESVWLNEIKEHLPHLSAVIVHHPSKQRRIELLNRDVDIYITNHDGVKVLQQNFINKKFDLVIIDESDAFKNIKSDRSKAMLSISRSTKGTWALNGAMTSNNILDAYGQIKVTKPKFNTYYTHFRDLLTTKLDEFTYIPKPGWEKILRKFLKPSIRFELDDCVDLPPITYSYRHVEMTASQMKAYKEMKSEYATMIDNREITAANAGVRMMKLMQISCGAVFDKNGELVEITASNKIRECLDIFNQLTHKQLIIFTSFVRGIDKIKEAFNKKKISAEFVYGDTKLTERSRIFKDFKQGRLSVLILQSRVASHGLNFTNCNTIVWYGPTVSNDVLRQANHRIRRSGQTKPQHVIYLESSPIEKQVYKTLENKEANSRKLLSLLKYEVKSK